MALMQITIIPLGTATTGVGDYVADVERFLRDREVAHTLNDMGTVIHGAPAELLRLANEIHNLPFQRGAQRVVTNITLDDRRDKDRGLGEKQEAVLQRLAGDGK